MELIIVIGLFVLIGYSYKRYIKYLSLENAKRESVEYNFKRKIDELNKEVGLQMRTAATLAQQQ